MLNFHSFFSFRYGVLSIATLIDRLLTMGYSDFVLTDINSSSGQISFIRECQKKGIKARVGIDFRHANKKCFVAIAKNEEGVRELNHHLTLYLKHPTYDQLVDHHFSNCFIIYYLHNYPEILKEDEWVGVGIEDVKSVINHKEDYPMHKLVSLQAMTFVSKREYNMHRLLRAIELNQLLSKLSNEDVASEYDVIIGKEVFDAAYRELPICLLNLERILLDCKPLFYDSSPKNTIAYTGNLVGDFELLKKKAYEGVGYRYGVLTETIQTRIEKELSVINQMQFTSYFLVAWDIITYAKSKSYYYVGRGSGSNSMVAYLIGITDVDPLELDLYFERFINIYRKNPPDFDLDFSWKERDDVLAYVFNRFPNVALIATYNTFQYKMAVRELGKVFGLPKFEIDKLAKGNYQLEDLDQLSKLTIRYSQYLAEIPSHLSIHAGGVIISQRDIHYYGATFLASKGYSVVQFSMLEAEDVGFYKYDLLSQRGLAKIQDCIHLVKQKNNSMMNFDIHSVNQYKSDPNILNILRKGDTIGCFYVESPAMRMLLQKLKADSYLLLVAASSIIRPGVAKSGMMREYIERHLNEEKRKQAHPVLLQIMPDTYGVMVYQEDVIKVAHFFADLTLADADVLRRGMSGKFRSQTEFESVKNRFFINCRLKGYFENDIVSVWKQIESFAGYAFSKGHSASYAVESFQSLYLKAYFPLEYMVSTLNNFGGFYSTEFYIREASRLGAKIELPCINNSQYEAVLIDKSIYLGFMFIKGIDESYITSLVLDRNTNGVFLDLEDVISRTQAGVEQITLLIRIGAFRSISRIKKGLLWQNYFLHSNSRFKSKQNLLVSFSSSSYKVPDFIVDPMEDVFDEMELLGFPILNPFHLLSEKMKEHIIRKQFDVYLNKQVRCYGYLITIKNVNTSNNERMCFATFIDVVGDIIDVVVFPIIYKSFPFYGKGIYELNGKVIDEHSFYSLELTSSFKCRFIEDVRYLED